MKYFLTIALFILTAGFLGCGMGAVLDNPEAGTGIGSALGLLLGLTYCFVTRDAVE